MHSSKTTILAALALVMASHTSALGASAVQPGQTLGLPTNRPGYRHQGQIAVGGLVG